MKSINKTLLITIGAALTLTLSACTGCSPHTWSSSESTITSVEPEPSSSEPAPKTYKIRWVNYDDSLLYTSRKVAEGEIPVYEGPTPKRTEAGPYNYVWTGWTPEVVPATANATYKATFTAETKTFTVTFESDSNVTYSRYCIENVPYGALLTFSGECAYVNDVRVTAETTLSDEEQLYYDFHVDRWNYESGTIITSDIIVQAYSYLTIKKYDFGVSAINGSLSYTIGDESYNSSEYFESKVKAYEGLVIGSGAEGELVEEDTITFISNQTDNNGNLYYSFIVTANPGSDPFSTYEFMGWYGNGEPLRYKVPLYGDTILEARYEQSRTDYSYIFEYEYDNLRREAIIVGIKEEYQHTNFPVISIPDYVNGGWAVTAVKNGTMAKVEGLQELYIPNTLLYFEEMPDSATFPQYLRSITLEEGNTHFHLMEGILYNYDLTEILVGTTDMSSYLENNRLAIPETVTHIWSRAFWYRNIERVYLSSGLTEITNYCFYANDLDGLTLPEGITRIGAGAFACNDMTSVSFPDACKTIESNAFENCLELKSVWIGKYTEDISRYAFMGCKKIESYYVDPDNVHYASYENAIYNKYLTTLYFYPCIFSDDPSEKLAPTLEVIFAMAFQNCHFTTFHIPEGVTRVYGNALYYCSELTEIYFPISIQQVGWAAFSCCYEVNYAYYPGTVAQWEALTGIDVYWGQTLRNLQVLTCSDGTVEVKKFNA